MVDLKPCPFCGGKIEIISKDLYLTAFVDSGSGCIHAMCNHCRLDMWEHKRNSKETYEILVERITKKWNRRVNNG